MIKAFFQRIGMPADAEVQNTLAFLSEVQRHFVLNVAYENLDILMKKPILLSKEALYEKIVLSGRGGYCFEVNGLLKYMLEEMGFAVTERFARFLRGEPTIPMRRHRVSVVSLPDGDYFVDAGVGQTAPRLPVKLEAGLVQRQGSEVYKAERHPVHGWVIYDLHRGEWREFVGFSDDVAFDVDFVQPSFFCEAHPDSVFNKQPMIAIKTESGRKTIDGRTYKVFEGEALTYMEKDMSEQRMKEVLRSEFKLTI